MNKKLKKTVFIWNQNICINIINVTFTFEQCNAFVLNKKKYLKNLIALKLWIVARYIILFFICNIFFISLLVLNKYFFPFTCIFWLLLYIFIDLYVCIICMFVVNRNSKKIIKKLLWIIDIDLYLVLFSSNTTVTRDCSLQLAKVLF